MGIRIGEGSVRRDWGRVASAAAESVVQIIALGAEGFGHAISALFRALENLRGDDDVALRATRLVMETLAYAASGTIAATPLQRTPDKAEVKTLVDNLITRAASTAEREQVLFQVEHLEFPTSFRIFNDAASQIFRELRLCRPRDSEAVVVACQSAFKFDPRSASNFDPFERRVLAVAVAPSELVRVAETARARVVG